MRIRLTTLLLCAISYIGYAQPYNVAFDNVSWAASHGGITLSNDTVTIDGQSGVYKRYEYTLNVDPNIEDLYFTARIHLDNIVEGTAEWDKPKMRIENTSGGKLINWNISNDIQGQWAHVGVKIENFDNLGLSQVVLIFGFQNATGTMMVTDPWVSSTPTIGNYIFPYSVPGDPSVTLDISSDQYHPFQNDLLSTNSHFTWATYTWEDQNVKDLIYDKFPMQNLRFPGGTVANFYNWQTDDFYQNVYSTYNNTANTGSLDAKTFGYPGYVDVARTLGGSSTLLFNVFSDDEALSQGRLQDRIASGLDIKWIEMGNENYFSDQAYGYVDDRNTGLNGNNDGHFYDEYINHTKDLASWLKAIDPDIKVAVNTHDDDWNIPLAAENYYDACVMHNYIFVNSFMMNQYAAADFLGAYKTTQERLDHYVATFGGDEPVIMSEWGLLSEMPTSFLQVIGSADNFLSIERGNERGIVEQAGIHMLYHGDFIGEASLVMHNGTEFRLNPIGVMYSKLYEVFQNHNVYDAYSTSAELETDLDAVHAKAVDLGDSIYVFVVNKLPVASPLNLSIDGSNYTGNYSMETYSESMNTELTANYSLTDNPWTKTTGSGGISVPANSISVVTVYKSNYEDICQAPDLGDDIDLCNTGTLTLDPKVSVTNRTFEWYQDGVLLGTETGATLDVTTGGEYKVITDSAGCLREDIVIVSDEIENFYFGADQNLCTSSFIDLDANVANPNVTFDWSKDGVSFSNNSPQYTVYEPGTYRLEVSATGCSTVSDEIVITSDLPSVTFDTLCSAGTANLQINETGSYSWYDAQTGGTQLSTSLNYSPSVSSTTTYYVQDDNVESYNIGITQPTGTTYGGTTDYTIWGRTMYLDVDKGFNFDAADIFTNSTGDITITISGTGGTFVHNETNVPHTGKTTPYRIYPNIFIPEGDYTISFVGTTAKVFVQVSDLSNNIVPGVVEFGGTDGADHYGYFYNWDISIPNTCPRTPVHAVIDPGNSACATSFLLFSEDFESPTSQIVNVATGTLPDGPSTCTRASRGSSADYNSMNVDMRDDQNCSSYMAANPESPCSGYYTANTETNPISIPNLSNDVYFRCKYYQTTTLGWGVTSIQVTLDNGVNTQVFQSEFSTMDSWDSIEVKILDAFKGTNVTMSIELGGGNAVAFDDIQIGSIGGTVGIAPHNCGTVDCNGELGGSAYYDNCGICVGGSTGNTACTQDCNGDWGGTAYLDNCGTCVEGATGNAACTQDCNGDWGGTAYLDNCGTCVEGATGNAACAQDCNGDWGGTAYLDNCATCVGGGTGNTACTQDCNGDWGGTAYLDNCGTCVEGATGNAACTQDCNGDWGGTAYLDNCGTCVEGATGNAACAQDCNGDWGGTAYLDNCGTCVGGATGNIACAQDCNGDWGGTASIDVCGTCSGGNTGITPETDSDNCITSIDDNPAPHIQVYPNPTTGLIHIVGINNHDWDLLDVYGRVIMTGTENQIDITHLPAQLYVLRIDSQNLRITKH